MSIRIGVLGAARITPAALLGPARVVDGVEVVALAARDRARADAFAAKHGIANVFESYDEVLHSDDVDAVYIPLPNGLHGTWTIKAIEAGKHVLCEKPFTANADEARAVADVANASDRVVMEAFHWRYHPLANRVLDIISAGEIGDVTRVSATLVAPIPRFADIRWNLGLAGGSLMDMGCYPVSVVRTFGAASPGDEPKVVSATAKELPRRPGLDRHLDARLSFPSGVAGRIVTGMLSGRGVNAMATVRGTEGTIRVVNPLAPQLVSLTLVNGRNGRRRERTDRTPTYVHQLRAFVAAIAEGAQVITNPEWSVANMQVIDDCYRAAGMEIRQPTGSPA